MILMPLHPSRAVCTRGEAIRALCDNRDRYIAQSAATEAGKLGELPPARNWTDYLNPENRYEEQAR